MKFLQNKYGRYFSENIFRNLFSMWFLLFPFDANVLPVSIGFMTLYPFLVLTFLLLGYSFLKKPNEVFAKHDKLVVLFFFFWVAYGLAFHPFVHDKTAAFYEIRSIVLMAITVWLVFRAKYLLGAKDFFSLVNNLSLFIFVMLSLIAFAEYFTGIHFAGKQTEKLWNLPAGMHTYAPVFLYDNPNTFLSYLFGTGVIIFLTGKRFSLDSWKSLSIIFILFFFSAVADSKFGKISSLILFFTWMNELLHNKYPTKSRKYFWWMGLTVISLIICFLSKPIYFGPLWKDREHYLIPSISTADIENDKLVFHSPDSLVKQFGEAEVIKSYREYQMRGTDWGINIRKNLLRNGLYLTNQSNFIGIGPAQFRWYHEQKLVPNSTTTVTNPHDGLMEILSQYGLPVFIPFLFILFFYWIKAFRNRKQNLNYFIWLTACYPLYIIISDMPSSWVILTIAWILLPVLLISSSQPVEKNNG